MGPLRTKEVLVIGATGETGAARPAWVYLVVLLSSTGLMGSSFVAGKILLHRIPPVVLVGDRFLLAGLATVPLALLSGRRAARSDAGERRPTGAIPWVILIAIGLVQTTAVMALLFWSLESITPGEAAILLFTNPLWVALLAPLVLAERVRARGLAGVGVGIGGVILAAGALEGAAVLPGEARALAASLAWAGATLLTKRCASAVNTWWLTCVQMLAGAVALLVIARLVGQAWPARLSLAQWAWFLWLAIPASSGAFGLWFLALRWGGAARTSAYLFLVPLFTVLLAHLILGDPVTNAQMAGGVLIGAGVYLVNSGPRDSRPRTS